jgi:uncharacterized membrane protein YgaE (UPF0421/DUF939 family)
MTTASPPSIWRYLLTVAITLLIVTSWFFLVSGYIYLVLALNHAVDSHQTRAFWDVCINVGYMIVMIGAFIATLAVAILLYFPLERSWKDLYRRHQQSLR